MHLECWAITPWQFYWFNTFWWLCNPYIIHKRSKQPIDSKQFKATSKLNFYGITKWKGGAKPTITTTNQVYVCYFCYRNIVMECCIKMRQKNRKIDKYISLSITCWNNPSVEREKGKRYQGYRSLFPLKFYKESCSSL